MSLVATSSSKIRQLTIKDGQLIFVQDLGRIALDFNGKRVFYNQIVELEGEAQRQSLIEPLDGYYFVVDEACLWFYKNGWTQITGRPNEVLFVGVENPQLGSANKLYVDVDDKEISVWDETTGTYIAVANYTMEVSDSDIEGLFD
jgi:hypothetical protein